MMNRLATFDALYVFPLIEKAKVKTIKNIENVCVGSKRLLHFKRLPVCVKCGCEGTIFHVEENEYGKRTLSFCALKGDREVIMTLDHIIPKSRGGMGDRFNLQTMCFDCNLEKGDKIVIDDLDRKVARSLFGNRKYRKILGSDNVRKLGEIIWGKYNGNVGNLSDYRDITTNRNSRKNSLT